MVLGMLAERALAIEPIQKRTSQYPDPLQKFAAGLVESLREDRPDEKLETILIESVSWLVAVGICDRAKPIGTGTLHNWYLKHKKAVGDPVALGRPRNR